MRINKLKHYVAMTNRESTARNRYQNNWDPKVIEQVLNQEIAKYKNQSNKEKDNLIKSYSNELSRKDKQIMIMSESLHHMEIDNQSLSEIINNKDKMILTLQRELMRNQKQWNWSLQKYMCVEEQEKERRVETRNSWTSCRKCKGEDRKESKRRGKNI